MPAEEYSTIEVTLSEGDKEILILKFLTERLTAASLSVFVSNREQGADLAKSTFEAIFNEAVVDTLVNYMQDDDAPDILDFEDMVDLRMPDDGFEQLVDAMFPDDTFDESVDAMIPDESLNNMLNDMFDAIDPAVAAGIDAALSEFNATTPDEPDQVFDDSTMNEDSDGDRVDE